MKKILILITFLALAAFAQSNTAEPERTLQRPVYSFQTVAFGFGFWSNYEDEVKNPKKDYVTAFPLIRYGHIWEMTTHGAITAISTWNFEFGKIWEVHGNVLVGGRYSFLDEIVSPFIGAGLGLGMQLDSHFEDWNFGERWALGMSLGGEVGASIFHNSAIQLEVGFGFDVIASKVDFGKSYKSWNLFFGINY
ncbi:MULTISPECIES: hypothetical protein [Fibrobacter]|uniref:hypothetical protein n=1 Tax=Fibrobacter TaxID=832 RepID=UPI000B524B7F|nr:MULTISPECIES: hypothetical protein [Fibrobacter]MBO4830309.1 hypothetical protein [Fibrobacter sp.]OWV15526.1 hypothetical protein B7990_13865 [Fibrobacter sp. UWB4]